MRTSRPSSLPRRRSVLAAAALAPTAGGLAACGQGADPEEDGMPDLQAELPRAEPGPAAGAGGLAVPFTARMLGAADRSATNAVLSPLSAQLALTMAGLGAAGDTRAQMEEVLGGSIDELAENANTLATVLAAIGEEEREADDPDAPAPAAASLAHSTWLQEDMPVEEPFLEGLATYFGSGVYTVDFTDDAAREEGRERINGWVEDATAGLIEDLVPKDALDEDTRLVLVNALHLTAAWPVPLDVGPGTFTLDSGEELDLDMLHGTTGCWYEDELCRATALATYGDDLSLAVIQPVAGIGAVLDAWADAAADPSAGLAALLAGLEESEAMAELTMPGFDILGEAELTAMLQQLGMVDAFDAASADFSAITREAELVISAVLQKATITVDDTGMEAAAATAAVATLTSAPMIEHELVLDAPFLYVAYETSTLAPLVLGWIGDPTAQG
ncbi:serine protease [Brachybacterium phenoliresistens]|uniref:Serine protease n=1 Tax=Brachybacterium phenoliresistens TaxID=396014 RepID=Z9JPA1_9MICO|nr:serpin family protein [Brachybacterium phenoliresistens]EWS79557.1 serine protease [Brachybacterium phenoliresistens]